MRIRPLTVVLAVLALGIVASLLVRVLGRTEPDNAPQVQVLNGCGVAELAQKAAHDLRLHGLDVVALGNADSQGYRETLILVRRGHPAVGREVRDALGRGQVLEQRDPSLLVDVTVILGLDYAPANAR
jgi:hypothetical protein